MYDTVVMVSFPTHIIFKPIAKRIFGISIFGAINMQAQVHTNQQITKVAELVFFKRNDEEGKKQNRQRVFEQPVVHVIGTD